MVTDYGITPTILSPTNKHPNPKKNGMTLNIIADCIFFVDIIKLININQKQEKHIIKICISSFIL